MTGRSVADVLLRVSNLSVQFASQGQARALVLAWKVAEIENLKATNGFLPLLLLDDVSSELDPERNAFLMGYLADSGAQVFLTTAVLAVRAGDFAEGRRSLSVYEIRLLGGPTRGLADALSAWCLEQTTGERRHVDRLGLFGEAGPDAIRRFWPELADFLERAPAA